ncbi:MAG TPA: gephyrin-like molybdotransferase Glp [Candidatus Angelobacter sp.]
MSGVVTFEKACEAVQEYSRGVRPPQSEPVAIAEAAGRVLAEAIVADRDFPPFPRATRDGFAVRAADLKTVPALLRVTGQVKAGATWDDKIEPGEALEIMTGAAVPSGADAVVMVEYTQLKGGQVEIQRAVALGENIVPQGSETSASQEMLPAGTRLGFAQIAVAAAVGRATLAVYRKPRVAILATGDELVDVTAKPGLHQIRNSNTYSLSAQVLLAGGQPARLPVAPDEKLALTELIRQGLSTDLLLLSGGVSMGQFDLVEEVLASLDATFFFAGAEIQPGRPVVFGQAASAKRGSPVPFFGLPGNPVSTMVTFDLFVRPMLDALSGALPVRLPGVKARLAKEIKTKTGLTRFLPAILRGGLQDPEVEVIPWQGSGDVLASARANCYAVTSPDRDHIAAGEMISVLLRLS